MWEKNSRSTYYLQMPVEVLETLLRTSAKVGFRRPVTFPHPSPLSVLLRYTDHVQNIDRQHCKGEGGYLGELAAFLLDETILTSKSGFWARVSQQFCR